VGESETASRKAEIPARARVLLGIATGVALATLCSIYVTALVLIKGPSILEAYGATYAMVLLGYYGSGVVVGALVGWLLPLGRRIPGAMAIGGVSFGVVVAMTASLAEPFGEWLRMLPWYLGLGGAGGALGTYVWRRHLGVTGGAGKESTERKTQ
jgi:hypothetical protein